MENHDRYDLHDNPYSCGIRTSAKDHISHQGVVRLIAARESGWEGAVDDIVPLEKAYTERPMNIDDSMTLL
jgi:hypothetical protein